MRTHRRTAITAAALLIAALFAAGGCKRDISKNAYVAPPPVEVIVAHPVQRDVVSYLTYTGNIEASETVELRARVQGFLDKVNFRPGQRVKKGDVLFEIDKRQYEAAVQRAEAVVRAQQATLAGAENDARLARELADQRAGPEIDAVIKGARRDAAKADVARAQADLADAKLNLEYSTITAPIDGRITKNYVDIGNLVGRGEPTLLATIVQATPAFVSIDASESDVLAVRRGREKSGDSKANEPGQVGPNTWRPVELALADEPEFNYKGRVDYVEPQMNPLTGTLRVRTRFENPDETLLPGLFARARFPISTSKAVLVPESALLSDQQGRYALVVNDKNQVEVRRVRVGTLEGTMRVVEEGLTPQDRVVVLGVLKARPGAVVAPKLQEPPADGK
jgi:RND family efflux transporter MFP subunit